MLRFSPGAQKAVLIAQQEAKKLNHDYVGTEHILLGLAKAEGEISYAILYNLGLEAPKIINAIEQLVGRGDNISIPSEIPFTARAKRVLERSFEEAQILNSVFINTEHLLLGLAGEQEGVGAKILQNFNITEDLIRALVLKTISEQEREFKEEKENVDYEIISLPSFKSNKPYISGKLIRKLEKKNFDLIHIFSPYKLGRRMRIFGRKHKIPTFATFYLDYSKLALNNKEKKFKKFSKKIFLHFYHRVDTVWAIDEEAGEILKAYGFNRQVEFIDDVNKSSKSSDYSIMIERYIAEAAHPN